MNTFTVKAQYLFACVELAVDLEVSSSVKGKEYLENLLIKNGCLIGANEKTALVLDVIRDKNIEAQIPVHIVKKIKGILSGIPKDVFLHVQYSNGIGVVTFTHDGEEEVFHYIISCEQPKLNGVINRKKPNKSLTSPCYINPKQLIGFQKASFALSFSEDLPIKIYPDTNVCYLEIGGIDNLGYGLVAPYYDQLEAVLVEIETCYGLYGEFQLGKKYSAVRNGFFGFMVADDKGKVHYCHDEHCPVLNGGSWSVISAGTED